jgi:hypothetical protein
MSSDSCSESKGVDRYSPFVDVGNEALKMLKPVDCEGFRDANDQLQILFHRSDPQNIGGSMARPLPPLTTQARRHHHKSGISAMCKPPLTATWPGTKLPSHAPPSLPLKLSNGMTFCLRWNWSPLGARYHRRQTCLTCKNRPRTEHYTHI